MKKSALFFVALQQQSESKKIALLLRTKCDAEA
jgi:hypothetical protein